MTKPTHPMNHPARILPRREVERRTGLSRSYIYRLSQDGEFPAPVQLTEHRIGWVESEIDAWIARRIEGRAEAREQARARARERKARNAA